MWAAFGDKHLDGFNPHEVFPPGKWRRVTPGWLYPTRCYERAFLFITSNPHPPAPFKVERLRLVHGDYQPPDLPFRTGHAWVEVDDDTIFDGVLQGFYRAADYLRLYRAQAITRYNLEQSVRAMLVAGHIGPWHTA